MTLLIKYLEFCFFAGSFHVVEGESWAVQAEDQVFLVDWSQMVQLERVQDSWRVCQTGTENKVVITERCTVHAKLMKLSSMYIAPYKGSYYDNIFVSFFLKL